LSIVMVPSERSCGRGARGTTSAEEHKTIWRAARVMALGSGAAPRVPRPGHPSRPGLCPLRGSRPTSWPPLHLSVGHCQARCADCMVLRHAWYTAGGAEKKALFLMQHRGALTPDMYLLFHGPVL